MSRVRIDRRRFSALLAGLGAGAAFADALWAASEAGTTFDRATLAAAERVAGLEFTDPERDLMLKGLDELRQDFATLRTLEIPNQIPPALAFDPSLAGEPPLTGESWLRLAPGPSRPAPETDVDLAFLPAVELGRLLRRRTLSSERLTRLYLDRLKAPRPDPALRGHADRGARPAQARRAPTGSSTADSGAARCTASPGAPRTCSRRADTRPPGARCPTVSRCSTRTPRWSHGSSRPARCWSPS